MLWIRLVGIPVLTIACVMLMRYGWDFMEPRESAIDDIIPTASMYFGMVCGLGAVAIIAWP